jgi:hypothetical protein
MDWAIYQPQVRFDPRAERADYERLFRHSARVLQDRMVRRSRTDRTRTHDLPEWEKVLQRESQERRLLYHARVLGWGNEKRYYFAHQATTSTVAKAGLNGIPNWR